MICFGGSNWIEVSNHDTVQDAYESVYDMYEYDDSIIIAISYNYDVKLVNRVSDPISLPISKKKRKKKNV